MNKRNILYGAIIVICIIAIIIAVYHQIFSKKVVNENKINVIENATIDDEPIIDPKDTLAEFNKLFTNTFDDQNYSKNNIKKIEGLENEDIVYTAYNIKEEVDEKYSLNVKLPVINIDGNVAAGLNGKTQKIFADKTSSILSETEKYTIYSVEYTSYLNDNILSLVIKSTLKEGNSAQRIIVQTYNYDIENNEEVTLNQVLDKYQIKTKDVNKKIEQQVKEASNEATTISQATGQIVYKRNLEDSMYTTDKASNFFIGKDGQIYIVYAYGNNNVTSEIDIIKI